MKSRTILLALFFVLAIQGPVWAGVGLIGSQLWGSMLPAKTGVTMPAAADCAGCHRQQQGAVMHRPYLEGSCSSCHLLEAPVSARHGSLVKGINSLCQDCHSFAGYNHPLKKANMTCLSCHRPHRSDNEYLLNYGTDKLCMQCHEQDV